MNKKLAIRSVIFAATLALGAPAMMGQAHAQAQPAAFDANLPEGLQLRAVLGIEHDDNVTRVPAGEQSDTAVLLGVGLRYEKRYSLQRLRADIQAEQWRYQDLSDLNYSTVNYSLAWDWAVTPRLRGVLSADRRQFREVTTVANANRVGRRTERAEVFEATYGIAGPWRLLAGVSHTRAESSAPGSWDASPDVQYAQVGVRYEFPSGSELSARLRRGDGEYRDPTFATPLLANRDFKDTEAELTARWALTGKTTIDGRIAMLDREHDGAPQLDFDGVVGNVNATWNITAKTRLVASYLHDLSSTGQIEGGHVVSDRFIIAPVWQATAKTAFNIRYDRTRRDWEDLPVVAPNRGRTETLEAVSLGVDWEALRSVTVSAYARRERLDANLPVGYRANVYGVAVRATFF